jgi:hypothetical protein
LLRSNLRAERRRRVGPVERAHCQPTGCGGRPPCKVLLGETSEVAASRDPLDRAIRSIRRTSPSSEERSTFTVRRVSPSGLTRAERGSAVRTCAARPARPGRPCRGLRTR